MKYPNMRDDLLNYLCSLSDREYQINSWVNKIYPSGIEYDCLDSSIHFIFDDTDFGDAPENSIGDILLNKEEADSIAKLVASINYVFEKYGTNMTDDFYIGTPEWDDVLSSASTAYKLININNGIY